MFLLVPTYPGSPRPKAVKRLCACVRMCVVLTDTLLFLVAASEAHVAVTAVSTRVVDAPAVITQIGVQRTLIYICTTHTHITVYQSIFRCDQSLKL